MATVLIAERDRALLQELRPRFDALGLTVVEAFDWPDTLRKAALNRPDLVLVAEDLPQLATLQMCLQLRGIGGMFKTPLVLILAEGAEDLSPEAMRRSRVDEAISRPRLRQRLLEMLRRHLPTSGSGDLGLGAEASEQVGGLPLAPDGTVASASGDLVQLSAAALLGQLACRWSSGTLALEAERTDIRVYLHRGNIVDASNNIPGLSLDALLVQNRLVSKHQLREAEDQVRASAGILTLDKAILAQGSLDEERLRRVLLYQRQHAVLLPLSWREGRFGFEPGPVEPERLAHGFGTIDILFGGLRSLRDVHRIEPGLPLPNWLLRRTPHAFDGFQASKLTDVERTVLLLLDDEPSVATVLSLPRIDRSEAVRAVCALFAAGVIEAGAPDSARSGRTAKSPAWEAPVPEEELAIEEGSLAGMPVAKLLAEMYADRRTGVVFFRQDSQLKEVDLERGRIVAARSNQPEDGWPRVFLRRGLITPWEARFLEGRGFVVEAPCSSLPLPPESLVWKLQPSWLRIEDVVTSLFGWQSGVYRFEEGRVPEHDLISDRTESLLLEGLRRLGGKPWTTTSLPPATHYVVAQREAFALELGPAEESLLVALNGQLTVVETLELSERIKLDVQPLFHGFLLLGLVRTAPRPVPFDPMEVNERRRKSLLRQIEEFLPLAECDNFFAVLGVGPDASAEAIRARYKLLRERFHPERSRELGLLEAMDPLSDVFGKIYLAYQSLSKPELRQAHLDELERQAASRVGR
jgi:DNA-binding response OmpR family regulator